MSWPPAGEGERIAALGARLLQSEQELTARIAVETGRSQGFMRARMFAFVGAFACFFAMIWFHHDAWGWYGMTPLFIAFTVLVLRHRPVKRELERLQRILGLVRAKSARLDRVRRESDLPSAVLEPHQDATGRLAARAAAASFSLPEHVRDDLGLYGSELGIFPLLDTTATRLGRLELSRWISAPTLDADEILHRQEAARDLEPRIRLREKLEQELAAVRGEPSNRAVRFLLEADVTLEHPTLLRWVPLLTVVLALGALAGILFSLGSVFVLVIVVAEIANRTFRDAVSRTAELRDGIGAFRGTFRALDAIERRLATAGPGSPRLRALHERIRTFVRHPDQPVDRGLRALAGLDFYRAGLIYVVVTRLTLYDICFLPRLTTFWTESRERLRDALAATAELEALLSLVNLKEEQVGYVWPEPIAGATTPHIEIESGAHPLLGSDRAVANSITLASEGRVRVVTGSNMSGKSTFLRMCGISVVLAQAGAPVRARAMRWTPVRILTDINVRDSLDDGQSYFAVEVGRVLEILETASTTPFLIALLDEVFRGTNTHEKVAAGIEVTRYLAQAGGLALVATHDHDFTSLEGDETNLGIRNNHFSEDILEGNMVFNYRLHEGPAVSRNALRLLGLRGYPPQVVEAAMRRAHESDLRTRNPKEGE